VITPESIDRVREAADILEIVGEHVKLKRSGSDWRGPCPFHGGKGPNFSVSPKRNAYHCFKCGVSGDAIGFVREHLGMDFVEAVRYVAARAGVEVKETWTPRDQQERDTREPLWEAMSAAHEAFRELLWDDPEAQVARDYLARRGLGRAEADRFGLGWAPRDGLRVIERLRALGHDDARLLEVGLLGQREDAEEPHPRFRARLIFPIQDEKGRTIAFGGRILEDRDGVAKYLNSPETPLFSKSRTLYGMAWAKHPIRKAERVLVVEGYFDTIRLALAGIEEAVAPLGTALTELQAGMLAKLTGNVFLLYDSDEAGLKATFRAGLELLRVGVSARVVTLPAGEDPDTFVRAQGLDAMERALAQGVDIFDRQIQLLERKGWFAELHRKRRAIDKLLPTLRAASDPVTRALYVSRLAEVAGMDREVIAHEAEQPERRPGRPAPRAAGSPGGFAPDAPPPWEGGAPAGPREAAPGARGSEGVVFEEPRRDFDRGGRQFGMRFNSDRRRFKGGRREEDWASSRAVPRVVSESARVLKAERVLVWAMLRDRDIVELVAERWDPGSFHHLQYRPIFERLLEVPDAPVEQLANDLPADVVQAMDELLGSEEPGPNPRTLAEDWLRRLQVWAIEEELQVISARLVPGAEALTDGETDALLARKQLLRSERAALSTHFSRVRQPPAS
jgi:DNA primase